MESPSYRASSVIRDDTCHRRQVNTPQPDRQVLDSANKERYKTELTLNSIKQISVNERNKHNYKNPCKMATTPRQGQSAMLKGIQNARHVCLYMMHSQCETRPTATFPVTQHHHALAAANYALLNDIDLCVNNWTKVTI